MAIFADHTYSVPPGGQVKLLHPWASQRDKILSKWHLVRRADELSVRGAVIQKRPCAILASRHRCVLSICMRDVLVTAA